MKSMSRINKILKHSSYEDYSQKNKQAEQNRIYCRHGADHGLAVARIAYIYLLENYGPELEKRCGLSKEMIYAAGILHDIGRWVEYETKEDHAFVGGRLARPILKDCGFYPEEMEQIILGILEHRLNPNQTTSLLGKALALADDWARDCRNCLSQASCYKYNEAMDEIII